MSTTPELIQLSIESAQQVKLSATDSTELNREPTNAERKSSPCSTNQEDKRSKNSSRQHDANYSVKSTAVPFISGTIVDHSIKIHKALGPGLLESVYQRILAYELRKAKFDVQTEIPVPVKRDGHEIDEGFRADLIVNAIVLVELKFVESISKVHTKQTLTYLKLTELRLGLLINFGAPLMKDGIHRIVNGLDS